MSNVIIDFFKGQRMDLTVQMKDADRILEVFRSYDIRFDKKFTSINDNGPSTITFKSVRCERVNEPGLFAMLTHLQGLAEQNDIGDVGIKFRSFFPKNQSPRVEAAYTVDVKGTEVPEVTDDTL